MSEPTPTELKAALFDLVSATPATMLREDRDLAKAEDMLTKAVTELVTLRSWREQAEPLLRALSGREASRTYDEMFVCPFLCTDAEEHLPGMVKHTANCPITQARALLGEGGGA